MKTPTHEKTINASVCMAHFLDLIDKVSTKWRRHTSIFFDVQLDGSVVYQFRRIQVAIVWRSQTSVFFNV